MKKGTIIKKSIASFLVAAFVFQMVGVHAEDLKGKDNEVTTKIEYNVTQIIIKYKDKANKSAIKNSVFWNTLNFKMNTKKELKVPNAEVIDVGSTDHMQETLDTLKKNSGVEWAEPNYKLTSFDYSIEPLYSQEWGLENSGQVVNEKSGTAGVDINATAAWDFSDGAGTLVGILDTGIDITHPDLLANIFKNSKEIAGNGKDDDNNGYADDVTGFDFLNKDNTVYDNGSDDKHGTNVAGIIAASANGSGITGVAPKAQILPLKFMSGSTAYTSDAIDAIEYAKSMGVKILNISWGGPDYNVALKDEMSSADMLFVCAAGNNGTKSASYPAAFNLPNTISVGAVNSNGAITDYTSITSGPDIYAPGDNILTTDPDGATAYVSGTSFSAAYVSGIAALVKEEVPGITTDELKLVIKSGYKEIGDNKVKVADANNAIKNALPLKFLSDQTGRLSQAMALAGKVIIPDVAELLTKYTSWNQLDDSQKNILSEFFNMPCSDMDKCSSASVDLVDSVVALLSAQKVSLDVDNILALMNTYQDNSTLDREISNLSGLIGLLVLSSDEKNGLVNLMKSGYSMSQIANALVVAKAIGVGLPDVIGPKDDSYDFTGIGYAQKEKDCFVQLVQKYNLNVSYMLSYLRTNHIAPSRMQDKAYDWQVRNNFYVVSNQVTAFSASPNQTSDFNKYKVSTGNNWSSGNALIDKTDGMLTYSESLLSLAGRNSLSLNLGLRFDSDVADAVINAKDPMSTSGMYRIEEYREYYWRGRSRDFDSDITIYTDVPQSEVASYEEKDGEQFYDEEKDEYYFEYVTVTPLSAYTFTAYENKQYYTTLAAAQSKDQSKRDAAKDITISTNISEAQLGAYEGNDGKVYSDTSNNEAYIDYVTITASVDTSNVTATGIKNYNDSRYGMGIGWALDLPSIEMVGSQMYLHLPGGTKYLLRANSDGSFAIDGYLLNDVSFGPSTAFTVSGGLTSAYCLTSKDGSKVYFSSDGRYLGTVDLLGNKIQVYYNSDSSFDRIVDTAGRYVKFLYGTGSGTKTVTIQLVDNTQTNPVTKTLYTISEKLDSNTNTYVLDKVIDAAGREIVYGYNYYDSSVIYNYRSNTAAAKEVKNKSIVLSSVKAPTGAVTKFDYTKAWRQYGYAGDCSYMRVADTYNIPDGNSTDQYNYTAFSYFTVTEGTATPTDNTYWMYARNAIYPKLQNISGESVAVTGADRDSNGNLKASDQNQRSQFDYDRNRLAVSTMSTYANGRNKTVDLIVSRDAYNQATQVQEKTYSSDGTTYTLSQMDYTWDQYGNQLSAKTQSGDQDGLKKVDSQASATYDYTKSKVSPTATLQFVLEDGSTQYATKAVYTIDAARQKITDMVTSAYNMTSSPESLIKNLITQHYVYDSYGNLTDNTAHDETSNDTVSSVAGTDNQTVVSQVHTAYAYDNLYHIYQISKTVTGVKDADGNASDVTVSASYPANMNTLLGLPTDSWDANGNKTTFEYDAVGNVKKVTNPDGTSTTNTIDYTNRTVTTKSFDKPTNNSAILGGSRADYDVFGNVIKSYRLKSDGSNYDLVSEMTYNNRMQLNTQKNYLKSDKLVYNTITYQYDGFGRTTEQTVKDQNGNLVGSQSQTFSQAKSLSFGSTSANQTMLTTRTDASNANKTSTITSSTDALGRSSYTTYNDGSHDFTDKTVYNNFNYIKETSGETIDTTTYSTNLSENQTTVNSGEVENGDDTGKPIDNLTNYNGFGQQVVSTDANGSSTVMLYDALGRVIETYTPFDKDSAGNITYTKSKTFYDKVGNIVKVKQQNNKIGSAESFTDTRYVYDTMGNIVQVQQVNGGSSLFTQYYYDSQGRLLRMYKGLTSPLTISGLDNYATTGDNNFEVTKYTYDFYGNVKTYTNGTENTESYTYNDLTGQLLVKTLANGDQMTYTYDNAGNVLTITGAQTDKTTLEYTYTYDLTGNVTKAKNGDCETTYEYDDMGRCISETDKYYSGNTYVKNYAYSGKNISDYYLYKNNSLQGHECYEYESNGRLTGQIYSHNDNIEAFKDYFDPNGNVILHVAVQDQMDVLPLTINTYNMANLATFTQYWTGVKNSLGIDMGGSENYDYRLDGNLVGDVRIWIANSATNTVDYTSYNYYDGLSRLKTESYSRYDSTGLSSQWTDTYYFDDYNNRTGLTHTDQLNNTRSSQTTSNYDNSNRLKNQTITTNGTATTNDFDYDDAGNLKSKKSKVTGGSETTTQYTYDALNQLTGVNTGSTSTTFRYDSLGQRINKTSGSVTTESVWNQGRLSTDYVTNGSNTTFRQYTLNNEGVLIGDNGAYINYLNAQGNVAFYQDTSNTFTACNYDAYGNNTTGVSASSPYGYRNQYYDSETGLYYLNARYYDPTTGTFTQEDTYWGSTNSPATLNLYGYCGGNPVMASDPSGHHFDIGDTVNVSGVGTADSEGHGKTIEFNVDSMKITGHKNGRYQMSDRDGPVGWFTEDQLWYGPDVSNGVVDNGSPSGGSGGGSGGVTPGPSGVSSKDGHSSDNGSGNSNTSSDNSNQTISQGSPPPKTSGSWFISGEEAQKLGYTTTDGDTSGWCIKGGGIQISISGSFGGWNLSFTAILVWYTSDSFSYEPGLYSPFCPKGIPYIYVCVELDGGFADFNKILASLVEITTPQGARNILTGLLGPGYSFSIGAFVIWGNNQFRNAYDFTGVSTNVSATYNHVTAFGSKSSSYYTVGAGYSSAWIGGSYGHSDTWLVNPKYVQDLLGVRY